jgi:hypothetical protein
MTSRRAVRAPLAVIAALAAITLSACGGDAGDVATDPAADAPSTTATPSPSGPTEEPKPGSLPDFPYTDYSYTLQQRCFCAFVDQKYLVTVVGGEATEVRYATPGEGHEVGDEVPQARYLMLSIQDIIDRGNDSKAAQVEVDWQAGQLYPTSVFIDQDKMVADEEVTWVISDVQTA